MMTDSQKHIALVLFGGSGERFGLGRPKQFVDLGGHTLLEETVSRIDRLPCVDEILVVSREVDIPEVKRLLAKLASSKILGVVPGGSSRQESAFLGLKALESLGTNSDAIVAICDGDRPCVEARVFEENFTMAQNLGGAITAIPSSDSTFLSQDGKTATRYLRRQEVYLAQTPQTFRLGLALEAHRLGAELETTDDASLLVNLGKPVGIVLGDKENIKITTPEDLQLWKQWKAKNQ